MLSFHTALRLIRRFCVWIGLLLLIFQVATENLMHFRFALVGVIAVLLLFVSLIAGIAEFIVKRLLPATSP